MAIHTGWEIWWRVGPEPNKQLFILLHRGSWRSLRRAERAAALSASQSRRRNYSTQGWKNITTLFGCTDQNRGSSAMAPSGPAGGQTAAFPTGSRQEKVIHLFWSTWLHPQQALTLPPQHPQGGSISWIDFETLSELVINESCEVLYWLLLLYWHVGILTSL